MRSASRFASVPSAFHVQYVCLPGLFSQIVSAVPSLSSLCAPEEYASTSEKCVYAPLFQTLVLVLLLVLLLGTGTREGKIVSLHTVTSSASETAAAAATGAVK